MTPNQEKAANNLIKMTATPGMKVNKSKALKEAGYSDYVAKNPKQVLESLGFKEALAKYGLTEERWAAYLSEDLEAKPQERLGELKLAAEVLGLSKNVNLNVTRADESINRIREFLDGDEEYSGTE